MSTSTVAIPGLVAGTWTIDPAHSEVGFTVRHLMVSKVRGTFKTFDGTITIADDPLESRVEARIDAFSVDTRDENRDNHLRSSDFFEVEKHPQITFVSTSVRPARPRLRRDRRPDHPGRDPLGGSGSGVQRRQP